MNSLWKEAALSVKKQYAMPNEEKKGNSFNGLLPSVFSEAMTTYMVSQDKHAFFTASGKAPFPNATYTESCTSISLTIPCFGECKKI